MKKLIAIVFAICLAFLATSCKEIFFGEGGIVTKVEYNGYHSGESGKFLYDVEVTHPSSRNGGYILKTNHLYHVGDTILIEGRRFR